MGVVKANLFFKSQIIKGPVIILDGLLTPENIGSALRLAANIACQKIIITERVELKQSKIERIARNSLQYLEIVFLTYKEISEQFNHLIAIETCSEAKNIYKTTLPIDVAFIVGNEKYGISEELLSRTHQQVFIPMPGPVKSLNVSHALSIALFEWYRQNYVKP